MADLWKDAVKAIHVQLDGAVLESVPPLFVLNKDSKFN